jgi:DNA-binding NarL/FixJ family response regulator
MQDDDGRPLLTITIATPIDPQHFYLSKIERLLEENTFLRKNQHLFATLGNREKQILTMMARDHKSQDIAKVLFLSEDTVKTHRRNIKKKLGIQNKYELMRFAQAFDLV